MINKIKNYIKNRQKFHRNLYIGLKIERVYLTKTQKFFLALALINIPLPTFSAITSPIIIKVGNKLSIKEKVKLR